MRKYKTKGSTNFTYIHIHMHDNKIHRAPEMPAKVQGKKTETISKTYRELK